MRLADTTAVLLRLPADSVSRHRGWMVHQSVGEERWTLSSASGCRLATFALRAEAELAMRRVSEVLDVNAWPVDDLHWVQVLWERVDAQTRQRLKDVLRTCGAFT